MARGGGQHAALYAGYHFTGYSGINMSLTQPAPCRPPPKGVGRLERDSATGRVTFKSERHPPQGWWESARHTQCVSYLMRGSCPKSSQEAPPKIYIHTLTPKTVPVALFRKSLCRCDRVKGLEMSSSWIWDGP